MTQNSRATENDAARGKEVAESGKYVAPRGEHLGWLTVWGIDVYENSPQPWIDALLEEVANASE